MVEAVPRRGLRRARDYAADARRANISPAPGRCGASSLPPPPCRTILTRPERENPARFRQGDGAGLRLSPDYSGRASRVARARKSGRAFSEVSRTPGFLHRGSLATRGRSALEYGASSIRRFRRSTRGTTWRSLFPFSRCTFVPVETSRTWFGSVARRKNPSRRFASLTRTPTRLFARSRRKALPAPFSRQTNDEPEAAPSGGREVGHECVRLRDPKSSRAIRARSGAGSPGRRRCRRSS